MFDANLMLRAKTHGNLTGSQTCAAVDFGGPDVKPLVYTVVVPQREGNATATVVIQDSPNGTTWRDFLTFPTIAAVGVYRRTGASPMPLRRAQITVSGSPANFGPVEIGVDVAGEMTAF